MDACRVCNALQPLSPGKVCENRDVAFQTRTTIWTRTKAVFAAANDDCRWCAMLWRGIAAFSSVGELSSLERANNIGFSIHLPHSSNGNILKIFTFRGMKLTSWTHLRLEFYVPEGLQPPSKSLIPRRHVPVQSNSKGSYKTIKEWIAACSDTHTACNESTKTRLPTRLLDVSNGTVRLCATVELGATTNQDHKYVALSHCWGNQQPSITTGDNLPYHLKGISFDTLPKTFQDAVVITRKLGLRFLWIDSLCIIQHDHDDWKNEAYRMTEVYTGAFVTVAATHADNGLRGCFHGRSSRTTPVLSSPDGEPQAFARMEVQHESLKHVPFTEPLLKRAWTFQEHLLSQRVIHYCQQEIIWECREGTACECTPTLTATANERRVTHLGAPIRFNQPGKPSSLSWNAIVEEYTKRSLTNPSDKIAALAGIHKYFQQNSVVIPEALQVAQHIYAVKSLLWAMDTAYCGPTRRRPEHDAPSWSWISMEGPVLKEYIEFSNLTSRNVTCCIDKGLVHALPNGLNHKERRLRINGRLALAKVRVGRTRKYTELVNNHRDNNGAYLKQTISYVGLLERNGVEHMYDPDESVSEGYMCSLVRHYWERHVTSLYRRVCELELEVRCLEIADMVNFEKQIIRKDGHMDHNRANVEKQKGWLALVLRRSSGGEPGQYVRIGIGCFNQNTRWFEGTERQWIEII